MAKDSSMSDTVMNDGRSDFDFFMGSWKVQHQRLRERLKGSTSWEEFEGTCTAHKILGGLGNFDEGLLDRETGRFEGATLRLFNPKSQEWSIYWSSSLNPTLDLPMIGRFENGRGEFYAHESYEGRHVYSRFIWSNITADSCQWEQAFSVDGGKTWETNWIMQFTRV
jgi:hypothetical protein